MATATLQQINDRITEIDARIFKGITGQIPMIEPEKKPWRPKLKS